MTPEYRYKIKNLLIAHESYQQFPYTDNGRISIGIGRNLSDRGITEQEAYFLLDDDIDYFYNKLSLYLKFFNGLSENRQLVLIDMCFNLGFNGFLKFKELMLALEGGNWQKAAAEILESEAAKQCPSRYFKLADIMETDDL